MAGIDKIIAKIEEDCKVICDDIIAKANAQAQSIINNAQTEAEKLKNEAVAAAESKCKKEIELAKSKAAHEYKKKILSTKIGIINEIIDEAVNKLESLPDTEYFEVIAKLVGRYAQNGRGELRFSKKDLERLPQDFEARLNQMSADSQKTFVIGSEPVDIDGGVVIVYNDIEQNCSFESLLNASMDEIKDELFEELFVRNGV